MFFKYISDFKDTFAYSLNIMYRVLIVLGTKDTTATKMETFPNFMEQGETGNEQANKYTK